MAKTSKSQEMYPSRSTQGVALVQQSRKRRQPRQVFVVTGNDTSVGKTVISMALSVVLDRMGVSFAVVKPFCSGGRADAQALHRIQRHRWTLDVLNPWHYEAPLAPQVAAAIEGSRVTKSEVCAWFNRWSGKVDWLVVEGAGGLLTPLAVEFSLHNLIRTWQATPLVVLSNRLGVLNQARMVSASLTPTLRKRAWWILVDPAKPDFSTSTNCAYLQELWGESRLVRIPYLKNIEKLLMGRESRALPIVNSLHRILAN